MPFRPLPITASSDRDYLVYRVEAADHCYKTDVQWRFIHDWNKAYADPRRTRRSRFAGTFVRRDIGGGRFALMPYEVERKWIAAKLRVLLQTRMHETCRRFDRDDLPISPASMAKDHLGCSLSALVEKFEDRMTEGMNWDNQGARGWVIDHIIPVSLFDFRILSHVKKACHHSNLRPCWALENIRKSNRIIFGLTIYK